jgi:tRNA threonylcarbamoyl adenosine modification protein YeaZ
MILGLDTATDLTTVAVVDGDRVVAEADHRDARGHAEALGPLLATVLASVQREDIAVIACGVGPGPYTGLRVGIAAAVALGAAWSKPVVGVCTLDAMAAAAGPGTFGVATDARRGEVYWAWYAPERQAGPLVGRPDSIPVEFRAGRWLGSGAQAHAGDFGLVEQAWALPSAAVLARTTGEWWASGARPDDHAPPLAEHGGAGEATAEALVGATLLPPRPLYLRRPDARPR